MNTIQSSHSGATREGETNDCVVRAIANVSGKPYDEVHLLLKKHGREDRKGTRWDVSVKVMKELGYTCIAFGNRRGSKYFNRMMNNSYNNESPKTLSKVVSDLPAGKYVVYYSGHATALVDGAIVDTFDNRKNRQVKALFYDPKQFEV